MKNYNYHFFQIILFFSFIFILGHFLYHLAFIASILELVFVIQFGYPPRNLILYHHCKIFILLFHYFNRL